MMSKAQLPLLTSVIMVTQAFISAPAGLRAKRSLKDRNQVLLLGYAAMIAADLTFAFMPTVYGEPRGLAHLWWAPLGLAFSPMLCFALCPLRR